MLQAKPCLWRDGSAEQGGVSECSETEPEGESEEADEHDEEQSLSTDRDNDTHLLL